MATITLSGKYKTGSSLPISAQQLRREYMFGVPTNYQGKSLSDDVIETRIKRVVSRLESALELKLSPTIIEEEQDFVRREWQEWGYIGVGYPVHSPISLEGKFNSITQIQYPSTWLSARKSSEHIYYRQMHIVPGGRDSTTVHDGAYFNAILPHVGLLGLRNIPNYWKFIYCTGWSADQLPDDILDVVGKLTAVSLLHIAGDILLGGAGLASIRVGLDNLSVSKNTTMSSTSSGYGARVKAYTTELKEQIKELKMKYRQIDFGVV
jgi:hypothetical protein